MQASDNDMTLSSFMEGLAAKTSTPGGGGAAAVSGSMGAALLSMVANFTIEKKGYENVDAEMRQFLDKTEKLRKDLFSMAAEDIRVFDAVMQAYRLPNTTDKEKQSRVSEIQKSLKEATDVPLRCAELAAMVIEIALPMAEKGNSNVISDVGVGVMSAYAALKSAALNVYINVNGITDQAFKTERETKIRDVLRGKDQLTEKVYSIVQRRLF